MISMLDFRRFAMEPSGFVADLGAACRGPGFLLLTGHGVDAALCTAVFQQADAFFALPDAEKAELSILNSRHNRGWGAPGDEALNAASGQVDSKETFNIGLDLARDDPRVCAGEPFRGPNQWPDLIGFRATMTAYFDAMLALGISLHRAFARDLGLSEEYFSPFFTDSMSNLRLLRYPTATGSAGQIGAGAHTDYGAITLLMTDGEAGLQVRTRNGDWTDVPHVEDAFVINIGDCLMRWTNDIYVSTPHRVLPPRRTRRSVAFFLEANPDTVIAALPGTGEPRYRPVLAADYLLDRLGATYEPGQVGAT